MPRRAVGGVRVDGLRELVRNLEGLGVDVNDIKEAFGKIAAEAAEAVAQFAPRRSGRLIASIKGSRAKNYAAVRAGSARAVPYAGVVNYGWPKRNIKPSQFMQRADQAIRPHVQPALQAAIEHLIRQRGMQ